MAVEMRSIETALSANVTWNKARIKLLARLLVAVIQTGTVNLAHLASVLQSEALIESNYKRLQRFFRFFEMPYRELAVLMVRLIGLQRPFILALDRTEWHFGFGKFNILVLGIVYRGAAIPILFSVLPKIGTSSYQDRKAILDEFLDLFSVTAIDYLTADREFHGRRWYEYLRDNQIRFCLRARMDTPVTLKGVKRMVRMRSLVSRQSLRVKYYWHERQLIWGVDLKIGSVRLSSDEWLIIVASPDLSMDLFSAYAARWEIETCFGCLKSRGFCLEETRLQHAERLKCLLAVLVLCFCWAIKTGEWIIKIRPLRLSKSHGRLRKSLFRTGFETLRRALCGLDKSNNTPNYRNIVDFLSCT